jgi:glutamate-ammonia-ligase adenylyltransferase
MADPFPGEFVEDAVRRARAESPFLTLLLDREPAIAAQLDQGVLPPLSTVTIDDLAMPVMRRLRLERRRLALLVAVGDLAGAYDLTAVTAALSGFADRALHTAIVAAIAERTPGVEPLGFAAIALGKQGSHELNY